MSWEAHTAFAAGRGKGGLGPGAQTCSRRSYDQQPWRPVLLVVSSCMKTVGNRPERLEEIMYGAADVGSVLCEEVMGITIHLHCSVTPRTLSALGSPSNPLPPPGTLQIQCQPANSAKHITAQTIAPERQTASRTMHRVEHRQ